jgi:peptidoglycan L-alanyl-D-glutamate endopeptidase CwlK
MGKIETSIKRVGDAMLFLQRFLKGAGLYAAEFDGIWGEKTDAASTAFEARTMDIANTLGQFDSCGENAIGILHPKAQKAARVFLGKLLTANIDPRIISGTRTYAEQNVLYRKGCFGNPPPLVTKAKGRQSNPNFGIAFDAGIFREGAYLEASPLYDKAAEVGLTNELEWGGNWRSFIDRPHYQSAIGFDLASVRTKFADGQVIV